GQQLAQDARAAVERGEGLEERDDVEPRAPGALVPEARGAGAAERGEDVPRALRHREDQGAARGLAAVALGRGDALEGAEEARWAGGGRGRGHGTGIGRGRGHG